MNRIEYAPLSALVSADRNPKAHNIEGIKASLRALRVIDAIGIVDERTGKLVGGHGRVEALRSMKDAGEAPPEGVQVVGENGEWAVPVILGWASRDDAEAEAAIIALNQHTVVGGWDTATLATMLDELEATGFDLDALGFDDDALDDLRAQLEEAQFRDHRESSKGARTEPTLDERLEDYKGKAIRSIILDYALEDYERVVKNARALREHHGIESNAELVAKLLDDAAAALGELPEESDADAGPTAG